MTNAEQLAESNQSVTQQQPVSVTKAPVRAETTIPKTALVFSLLAVGISIGLSVASYFNWSELRQLGQSQSRIEDRFEQRLLPLSESIDKISEGINQQQQQTDRQLQQMVVDQQDISQEQTGIDQRLSVLAAIIGRSEQGWSLAEVDYLLRIANQRLLLQRDINSATEALRSADARLRELADPNYLSVRKQISRGLDELAVVKQVDVAGLSLILENSIEQVDDLLVAGSRYQPVTEPASENGSRDKSGKLTIGNWRELPGMLWELVSGLFQIRQHDVPVRPMISTEHEYFLRENLRLQLAATRLALLRDDNTQYQSALSASRQWLQQHFAVQDERVAELIASIDRLAAVDIRPALPDVSASLKLLHEQMKISEQREELPLVPQPSESIKGKEAAQ